MLRGSSSALVCFAAAVAFASDSPPEHIALVQLRAQVLSAAGQIPLVSTDPANITYPAPTLANAELPTQATIPTAALASADTAYPAPTLASAVLPTQATIPTATLASANTAYPVPALASAELPTQATVPAATLASAGFGVAAAPTVPSEYAPVAMAPQALPETYNVAALGATVPVGSTLDPEVAAFEQALGADTSGVYGAAGYAEAANVVAELSSANLKSGPQPAGWGIDNAMPQPAQPAGWGGASGRATAARIPHIPQVPVAAVAAPVAAPQEIAAMAATPVAGAAAEELVASIASSVAPQQIAPAAPTFPTFPGTAAVPLAAPVAVPQQDATAMAMPVAYAADAQPMPTQQVGELSGPAGWGPPVTASQIPATWGAAPSAAQSTSMAFAPNAVPNIAR